MEFFVFEVLSLMSGWISVEHLSAMSILCTIYSTLMTIPCGLNVTLCTRVGTSVGMENAQYIKMYNLVGHLTAAISSVLIGLVFLLFYKTFISTFTTDETIILITEASIHSLILAIIPDGF